MADDNHACDCCDIPPDITLTGESRWAQCDYVPCGVRNFDAEPEDLEFYREVTTTTEGSVQTVTYTRDVGTGECSSAVTACSGTTTDTQTSTASLDDTDPLCTAASGSETITSVYSYAMEDGECVASEETTGTSSLSITRDGTTQTCSRTYDPETGTWTGGGGGCLSESWGCYTVSSTSSTTYDPAHEGAPLVEYAMADPKTCTIPDLGPWPGDDPDTGLAELKEGQSRGNAFGITSAESAIIGANKLPRNRRVEIRLKYEPTGTCYLKVWFRLTRVIEDGDLDADPPVPHTVEIDDTSEPYVWQGSGNPCFSEAMLPPEHVDNRITSPVVLTIEAPGTGPSDERITVTASILKYSFLASYDPDISDPENPQPNGFPDLDWEPAAP